MRKPNCLQRGVRKPSVGSEQLRGMQHSVPHPVWLLRGSVRLHPVHTERLELHAVRRLAGRLLGRCVPPPPVHQRLHYRGGLRRGRLQRRWVLHRSGRRSGRGELHLNHQCGLPGLCNVCPSQRMLHLGSKRDLHRRRDGQSMRRAERLPRQQRLLPGTQHRSFELPAAPSADSRRLRVRRSGSQPRRSSGRGRVRSRDPGLPFGPVVRGVAGVRVCL